MTARRTLAIAAAALLCGVGDVLLVLGSEHFPDPGVWAVFGPVVGWSFVGTGLYAWRRRPESRFGLLMVLVGFAWFLGPVYAADSPLVFTLGIVAQRALGPGLRPPAAELPDRQAADAGAAPGRGGELRAGPARPGPGAARQRRRRGHHRLPWRMSAQRAARSSGRGPQRRRARAGRGADARLCLVAVGMLVRQWRAAAAPERRSLVPLFASGGVTLALVAAYAVSQVDASAVDGVRGLRRHAVRVPRRPGAGGPLRLARRAHADGASSATCPSARTCATRLARALGDPALELAFWMPELTATSTRADRPPSCPARTTPAAP